MFESPDDLTAESNFRIMAVIDFMCLTMMATTEFLVDKVHPNLSSKQLTRSDCLHMIWGNRCHISAWSPFKIPQALVNWARWKARSTIFINMDVHFEKWYRFYKNEQTKMQIWPIIFPVAYFTLEHKCTVQFWWSLNPVFLVQADIIHQQNAILMVCQEGH